MLRFRLYTTSSGVTFLPSQNFASVLMVMISVRGSGVSTFEASPGLYEPSGCCWSSESHIEVMTVFSG